MQSQNKISQWVQVRCYSFTSLLGMEKSLNSFISPSSMHIPSTAVHQHPPTLQRKISLLLRPLFKIETFHPRCTHTPLHACQNGMNKVCLFYLIEGRSNYVFFQYKNVHNLSFATLSSLRVGFHILKKNHPLRLLFQ